MYGRQSWGRYGDMSPNINDMGTVMAVSTPPPPPNNYHPLKLNLLRHTDYYICPFNCLFYYRYPN